jgi:hypothetical protein
MIDRLLLNDKRIDGMIKVLRDVAALEDPVGRIDKMWTRPNGLKIVIDYFPSEINPKYAELIQRTQVDLLTEDEPGIFGCLAFFKTK